MRAKGLGSGSPARGGGGRGEQVLHLALLAMPSASCCCQRTARRPTHLGLGLAAPVSSLHLLLNGAAQLIARSLVAPDPHRSQAPPFRCTP